MENPTKGGGRSAGKNDPLPDREAGAAARELSRAARRGKPVPGGRAPHGGRGLHGRWPARWTYSARAMQRKSCRCS